MLQKNGAYSFKGIPYAAPPLGPLRWAPPTEPACSGGVSDAGCFGSMCAQVRPLAPDGTVMGQEDCLFLNVWTPTLSRDAGLPVVVWIHGGYLHMLSGAEPQYSPTEELAATTGLVYVSFNYRLNAFGFLALEVLRDGSPTNTSGQCPPGGGGVPVCSPLCVLIGRLSVSLLVRLRPPCSANSQRPSR